MFLLVPAYPGSPGQKAVKRLCVCACVRARALVELNIVLLCSLGTTGSEKTKPALPQRAHSQPALDFEGRPLPTVDELSLVGYPDDVEVSQLFEKGGM